MSRKHSLIESERLALQANLDGTKSQKERNKLGQFATPTDLAQLIVKHGIDLLPQDEMIRFMDPAFGTGSFYSALLDSIPSDRIESAFGYEIDEEHGQKSIAFWRRQMESRGKKAPVIHNVDFADAKISDADEKGANLLICNPPYIRHHHLDKDHKKILQYRAQLASGIKPLPLSGLYSYFILLSHPFMAENGIGIWLLPSEFMDVNHGIAIKRYLLEKVTLLQIHRYDDKDLQFKDALVSSSIIFFKNVKPQKDHESLFTYGGSLHKPAKSKKIISAELLNAPKWNPFFTSDKTPSSNSGLFTPISFIGKPNIIKENQPNKRKPLFGDFFKVRRGLVTGSNKFFIFNEMRIRKHSLSMEYFRPILPPVKDILETEIHSDENGNPLVEPLLFLLNVRLDEKEIAQKHIALHEYLKHGKRIGIPKGYLCRNRVLWYSQERRDVAPLLCTYMGRMNKGNNPFRFFLNHSLAVARNTMLMIYPKKEMTIESLRATWEYLNSIPTDELIAHGRSYADGLHKLEPLELCKIPVNDLEDQFEWIEKPDIESVKPKTPRDAISAMSIAHEISMELAKNTKSRNKVSDFMRWKARKMLEEMSDYWC